MTSIADLYLSGFSKPLGEWSERALQQVRDDVEQLLNVETNPQARVDLSETMLVLDAESQRRNGLLSPDAIALLQEKGATRSFSERIEQAKEFIGEVREALADALNRDLGAVRDERDKGAGLGL